MAVCRLLVSRPGGQLGDVQRKWELGSACLPLRTLWLLSIRCILLRLLAFGYSFGPVTVGGACVVAGFPTPGMGSCPSVGVGVALVFPRLATSIFWLLITPRFH
ncbi:hypothetical protein NDU88_002429 [Pleurodeles waltl]|uniref:Transmembrane protein n=1 Tax=Pleurodeles waltl TaxID=8319 RepID=A0AAV7M2E1_PLEWA|nr:hypothetical protein NDU88_002429 [Pleurodeles waltl]